MGAQYKRRQKWHLRHLRQHILTALIVEIFENFFPIFRVSNNNIWYIVKPISNI